MTTTIEQEARQAALSATPYSGPLAIVLRETPEAVRTAVTTAQREHQQALAELEQARGALRQAEADPQLTERLLSDAIAAQRFRELRAQRTAEALLTAQNAAQGAMVAVCRRLVADAAQKIEARRAEGAQKILSLQQQLMDAQRNEPHAVERLANELHWPELTTAASQLGIDVRQYLG